MNDNYKCRQTADRMQSTIRLPTAREIVQEQRDPIYKLSHVSTTQLRDKITTKNLLKW